MLEHTWRATLATAKDPGHLTRALSERKTGFEPAAFSLARRCSTTEPLPQAISASMIVRSFVLRQAERPDGSARTDQSRQVELKEHRCPNLYFQERW